ncbi:hypothetical protein [Luteibacter sp. UNCMF366Tsu5.1]|uniref:hypothetical protein n=1 Tax=Luteibacter sp. UNCMF366Tsu5.1 TaxID=1502758 RepID=UPI000908DBCE|nr:hypothetical protein [Luteibacter sp. UNCMF366Tsu5.1]SFW57274.1 hypothetical protein SAMN02800691_2240 [Luteibacter sp. UNCMF366Tsu5.1]
MRGRFCASSRRETPWHANATLSQYPGVMELAQRIEPDRRRLTHWWSDTPIEELARMTPNELAAAGQSDLLERFLQSILHGERD